MRSGIKLIVLLSLINLNLIAQKAKIPDSTVKETKDLWSASVFNGFKFRSIGPAVTSGRIVDLAVNPNNKDEYYVASASGGVWKTKNSGVTYEPIFDNEGSYSIGCVSIDPNNTNVVWVGSGENNNQRSVGYGDGIYKSEDAGKSWKNMGLKTSEHIGRIAIDPKNSDVIFVAAYGPLWNSGGDRGVYKTTDGGKTWKAVLTVSENTGFNEVYIDPSNSNIIYATAHQRQRKVFTYIGGGPESAVYKSTDAGVTWKKIMKGLPSDTDLGRIGLAISPVNNDYLFAIVEAQGDKGGFYASTDKGESWEKRSTYSTSGNYYQEIFCDPKDINRIYAEDVFFKVTDDGGKTFHNLGEKSKHVDNHVIWVDPQNTKHMLIGCDGGLYESFDNAQNWNFKENLPITQFYNVSLDNNVPFYNVYGGTQDNFSLGGPAKTKSRNGIVNSDWFVTAGGDGFESQADYVDPNIVYAESQFGGLVRYDRKSGEQVEVRPIEAAGEAAYRWNWDAPVLISQHDHKRLYFASNKVFRTDDQGNTWKAISNDLSRNVDRNRLTIMGKVWSVDAVAKNQSTDVYGQITTLAESTIDENILYAGTDDGLIYTTLNGGGTWTKFDNIPGTPKNAYVNQIISSSHNKSVAYVTFNQHRDGDFKPYIFKTIDGGKTWIPIQTNLPTRGTVYCVAEDNIDPQLLFAGTEFGVYFSNDGGNKWLQLKGGLPTIAVRDMEIQKRESDLVIATFGRGFYVLDDYSPLRNIHKDDLQKNAFIAPVKTVPMYIQSSPLGGRDKGFHGEGYWNTPNPVPGAVFTYYIKNDIKTIREQRQQLEKEKTKKGETIYYPSLDSLRLEDAQVSPYLLFTITDENGNVVRRIKTPAKKGLNRITWDFRTDGVTPINNTGEEETTSSNSRAGGIYVLPGNYKVNLFQYEDGNFKALVPDRNFKIESLNMNTLSAPDKAAVYSFGKKVMELSRAAAATEEYKNELSVKLRSMQDAALHTPSLKPDMLKDIHDLQKRILVVTRSLDGDNSLQKREFESLPSIQNRIGNIMGYLISSTAAPTTTFMNSYNVAANEFEAILKEVRTIGTEVTKLENILDQNGAPYTPGRIPDWKKSN